MRVTNTQMKILHVIPSLTKGGAERLCLDIVSELSSRKNIEVLLVILHGHNEYALEYPHIIPRVINSQVTPSISGKWIIDLVDWDEIVEEFKPDIIHSHLFEAEILTRQQLLKGVKYFTHCHDNMHQLLELGISELFSRKRLSEAYERRHILKRYALCNNRFVAISHDTFDYFSSVLPKCMHSQIFLRQNAINTHKFSNRTATFDIKSDGVKLINIGSFVSKKNQRFLLDVLLELNYLGFKAELTLIGNGPLKQSCEQAALDLGINSQVRFIGKTSNVENYLWDSQVYVHSATYEPFGLVLLEAMAAGLPIVSLNGKGNIDLVQNGKNGFLLNEEDHKQFASAIVKVIESQETWFKLSSNGRKLSSSFGIESYTDRLLELYSEF